MASTKNFVNQYNIQPRDLINFTIRINKNYSSPAESDNFLPVNFLNPYPLPHVEMNLSFLKFNLDEGGRLKIPVVNPAGGVVKKGSQIEIKYPENIEGVFFRYTTSVDLIPAYFSGEKYDPNNPPIIDKNMTVKVVACKLGYLDSIIQMVTIGVTDEESQDEMIHRIGAKFNLGAVRPGAYIRSNEAGFNKLDVDLNDDSSSHYTPGSMYQVSMHRRETGFMDGDNDDGL